MQFATLVLVVTSLSCASLSRAPVGATPAAVTVQDELPAAREGLAIPEFDAGDVSLGDLVREFARVTDQHVVMSQETRDHLQQTPVVVGGMSEIPPGEVYGFVEGLLYFHGFFTAQLKGGQRPLLGLYSGREVAMAPRKAVKEADLGKYADHPAFLIQTVVELENLDVRQLTTSMRGLLRDTNSQTILAVGDHGVALSGTGRIVMDWTEVMRATNEQARAQRAKRAEAQAAEKEAAEKKE